MKHIKLECTKCFEDTIVFRIVEQTHRENAFGNRGGDYKFKASNGYELVSATHPEATEDGGLFVRGGDVEKDFNVMAVSQEIFDRIVTAVKEYNKHFSDTPGDPRCHSDVFYIE